MDGVVGMRLRAAWIAAFAMIFSWEAAGEDGAATMLRERLRPHYSTLAAQAGIELEPNTPLWERSLNATVRATVQAMDQAVAINRAPRSFSMPTYGMEPTILQGELFYAFEDYYRGEQPERGAVVLYKVPKQGLSYIRRVIGLPGEVVEVVNGVPEIDGIPAERERLGIFVDSTGKKPLARFRERVRGGPAYEIVADSENPRLNKVDRLKLPSGIFLVLGDNREDISASAVPELGLVSGDNILDRPEIIWLSKDLSRIGKSIQPR